uniref:Uncharacterized protein n=1 Tax=Timema cristinae TaxID=61476 RepID=A0A7R9DM12_TIMCR|nr:unnamed protein product [Timema cristinae]
MLTEIIYFIKDSSCENWTVSFTLCVCVCVSENRHDCLKLSHHVDNFLGLKNINTWLDHGSRESRMNAVVMYLLEFPGLEKHDRFILETASKYSFKDVPPTNCTIFRALSNWNLLKDDKEGLNELDPEFVKLKELLEEHTGSVYQLGGSELANTHFDDDRLILMRYLQHLMSLPAPSPMSNIANRTVERVLEKLNDDLISRFQRVLTPYLEANPCKQPTQLYNF